MADRDDGSSERAGEIALNPFGLTPLLPGAIHHGGFVQVRLDEAHDEESL
jgi:hypothetical protein